MTVLHIDYEYYKFPENISTIEAFMLYVNDHYNSFIPLILYNTDECMFPYLIEEETKTVYVNVRRLDNISAEEATIIPTRKEYDDRLEKVVQEKCINCRHYEDDSEEDNLYGHRDKLSLDGKCRSYKKKYDDYNR